MAAIKALNQYDRRKIQQRLILIIKLTCHPDQKL